MTKECGGFRIVGVVACSVAMSAFVVAQEKAPGAPAQAPAGAGDQAAAWELPRKIDVGPGKLDISARLRLRYECDRNYDLKGYGTDSSDDLLFEKLWIDAMYRIGDNVTFFLRFQDSHFWLSRYQSEDFTPACSYEDPYDIREGYVEWKKILDTPLGFKVGRQIIKYADERIWGAGDWGNSGKFTWDAGKLLWSDKFANVDLIYGKRVIADAGEFDADHYDYDVSGAYVAIKQLPFEMDLFYFLKRDTRKATGGESGTNSLAMNAAGARLAWKPDDSLRFDGTVASQFGDYGNDDIEALGYAVSATYSTKWEWKPAFRLGYAFASGDGNPADGTRETFDTMANAVHSPYGLMDLVCWMNLNDYYAELLLTPPGLTSATLSYHVFEMDSAKDSWYSGSEKSLKRDKTGALGKDIGQEADVVICRNIDKMLAVEAGYGHFFAGKVADATNSGGDADWVFLQTTLTF